MPLPHSLTMHSLWPRLQFWVGGMLPGDAERAAQGDQACQGTLQASQDFIVRHFQQSPPLLRLGAAKAPMPGGCQDPGSNTFLQ